MGRIIVNDSLNSNNRDSIYGNGDKNIKDNITNNINNKANLAYDFKNKNISSIYKSEITNITNSSNKYYFSLKLNKDNSKITKIKDKKY